MTAAEAPTLPPPWYTPEREQLVQGARSFARERLRPVADELDPARTDIPRDVLHEMASLGYFGIMVPREYGGMGAGVLEYCMVSEELARAWLSSASIIARAQGFGTGVADPQRDRKAHV